MSAETRYHGHSDRGGIDPRVIDRGTLADLPMITSAIGYPDVNDIIGNAAYHLSLIGDNAFYNLNSENVLYRFASYGQNQADAFENYRKPNRLPAIYQLGFSPRETLKEVDVSYRLSKALTLKVGANNLLNQYPNKNNADLLRVQCAALDNAAVSIYPNFSPFGINGGYCYARLNYAF